MREGGKKMQKRWRRGGREEIGKIKMSGSKMIC